MVVGDKMKIVKIVTHHEKPERAAELYAEEGVIAIGFDIGDLTGKNKDEIKGLFMKKWRGISEPQAARYAGDYLAFRDKINPGDIVLAYAKRNKVALVGEIAGGHEYNKKNAAGDPKGEIRYPNQRRVKWWAWPRNFDRSYLPDKVYKKVALPGTIHIFEYDFEKLKRRLNQIPKGKEKTTDRVEYYLKAFIQWPKREEEYESRKQREEWYRNILNENTVDKISPKDIDKIFGELWTVLPFHKRSLTEFGDVEKSRKTLKYLLFGDNQLIERVKNVIEGRYKLKFFGLDRVSELLHIYNKNLPFLSVKTCWSIKHLGMTPKYEEGSVADEYEKYRQVFNSIKEECNLRDLKETELFLFFISDYEKITGKKHPFPLEVVEPRHTALTEIEKIIFTHLIAGRNIVFYGPPGTGKTREAVKIANEFCRSVIDDEGNEAPNFTFETANAEWTAYDVVGGPTISGARMLKFKPGFLTLAARKCKESLENQGFPHWLIIDEINRANLDLAFGKVFSLLDVEYRDQPLIDESELAELENRDQYRNLKIPGDFRILATMNTYDRAILFSLGYAFRRRFAFVEIASPFKEKVDDPYKANEEEWKDEVGIVEEGRFKEIADEIKSWVQQRAFLRLPKAVKDRIGLPENIDLRDRLESVCGNVEKGTLEPFNPYKLAYRLSEHVTRLGIVEAGYAQPVDIVKYALIRVALFPEDDPKTAMVKALDEAVQAYFIPHLEYYLPKARRKMTIGGREGEKEAKGKLGDLKRLFGMLGLIRSEQKVQETIKKLETGEISIL